MDARREKERPSAAERLEPLLEWLRVDLEAEKKRRARTERSAFVPKMTRHEMSRQLRVFVESFDAHPLKVGRVLPGRGYDLEELQLQLSLMLLHGGGGREDKHGSPVIVMPSLRFLVRLTKDGPMLVVSGTQPDLVLYLAARLVVDEQLDLDTCEAPAAGKPGRQERDWRRWPQCGNLFVANGPGRQRLYCSASCKRRVKENPKWRTR